MMQNILDNGIKSEDRTGVGTLSTFGGEIRYDLSNNTIPLFTTKRVFWKGVVIELLWILRSETNVKFLNDYGVTIWDEWKRDDGSLGPIYGHQWSNFNGVNQIAQVINDIKTNPTSRRLIVSAWNPKDLPDMALPPCHAFFQFYVRNGELSCKLTQRSCDVLLGNPFNVASYSLLTHLIAKECGLKAKEFLHSYGDAHIYLNHIDQVKLQLTRTPYDPPKIELNSPLNVLEYAQTCHTKSWEEIAQDIKLIDYKCHPTIKAPIAV